jgi:ceramide glucosyltransferase
MAKILLAAGLMGLLTSSVFTSLVLIALRRFKSRWGAVRPVFLPPVSLFKPVHGIEPSLEEHLETFFRQDYPEYEIIFGARVSSDPGIEAARRVAARHPHIPVKFVLTGEPWHVNAKVSTLEMMESSASYDIFVVSDSDVRVGPEYLREVVAPFGDKNVGAVTCLYRGVAGSGLWSKLEAAGMSIEMSAGVLVADLMEGMHFALGPTMAVRRKCVREIGGFGMLGAYCADDFVLGNAIASKGYTVVLSTHVIDHMVLNTGFADSQKHQIRWMKSTRFSRPKGHFGTCLTFSVPFGLISACGAAALRHPIVAMGLLGYSVLSRMFLALFVGGMVVRDRRLLRTALLYPLRDLLGFVYWAASYVNREIVWRNQIYRLAPGGLMIAPIAPSEPIDGEPVLTA